jgi:hypothetical protein
MTPRKCKDPQAELNAKAKSDKVKEENKKWMEESVAFQKDFAERCKDEEDQPD